MTGYIRRDTEVLIQGSAEIYVACSVQPRSGTLNSNWDGQRTANITKGT